MNKKEISEIRKSLKSDNCCIDKLCACYVTPDKQKKVIPAESFSRLDENAMEEYLEIFKKSISGSIGKQLNCLSFPNEAEQDGGGQNLLYELEKSSLSDTDRVNELFDRIIENYQTEDYYCIIIMHGMYDIVSKAKDDTYLDSESVYSHIICSICPANLSKASLSYNQDENKLANSERYWVVEKPKCAFLFPSFNDRMPDIHEVVVYNKKASELDEGIIENVLGCNIPASADEQENAFIQSVQAAFEENISFDDVSGIYDSLSDELEHAEACNNPMITQSTLKKILQDNHATAADAFDETFDELIKDDEVFIENIADKGKFTVKMDGLTIHANSDTKNLISVKEVDGEKCIVISPNGDLEVNGMIAKMF